MSLESLQSFMTSIKDSLGREACQAMDGSSDPSAFVALGKANGHDFTNDEVISYFNDTDALESTNGEYDRLATGVSMFRRMGKMKLVPSWAARMYNFSVQADMRFW